MQRALSPMKENEKKKKKTYRKVEIARKKNSPPLSG